MNEIERYNVRDRVYESLYSSNFSNEVKDNIAAIAVRLKEIHPNIDLENIYEGLKFNSGFVFDESRFKPWWGAFYSHPYFNEKGMLEKGYVCFRNDSQVDFGDFKFTENFTHEMLHSFAQQTRVINSNYYFNNGLGPLFNNINELFTDYCAMEVVTDAGYSYQKGVNHYFSYGDNIRTNNDTPGYSFFTFYGDFLNYMYGDKIISDMFNHTDYLYSNDLRPLFVNFNTAIGNINENQSVDNYLKADKALSLIASKYLEDNINYMSIEDYLKFRDLYKHSLPFINDKEIDSSLDFFDKVYYTNNINKNTDSKSFKDFKTKLRFIQEFEKDTFDFNSLKFDLRLENGDFNYYLKSNKSDDVFCLIVQSNGEIKDALAILEPPKDLNFELLTPHKKSLLSNLRKNIFYEEEFFDKKSFDDILSQNPLYTLDKLSQNSKPITDFEATVNSFAYEKSFIEKANVSEWKTLLSIPSFKDSTGKNASYLLLKGINDEKRVCDFISVYELDSFLEKDNFGKSFMDYALENKKSEYITAILLNSNDLLFSNQNVEEIIRDHSQSIYENPEVFFEAIKNVAASGYDNNSLTELVGKINKVIDLNNLKDAEGNNIANYLESNMNIFNLYRENAFDNPNYKEVLRESLIDNKISYTAQNLNGLSAFDKYSNLMNSFDFNINDLKNILVNTDVLDKTVISDRVMVNINSDIIEELKDNNFDFNSLKGDTFCKNLFNSKYVSDDVKVSVLLYNDSIGDSIEGKNFFYKVMEDSVNCTHKEFESLADLFGRISDRGFDLNTLTFENMDLGEFLISQNRFGDIRNLIRDDKLDLFTFSEGNCLYNRLVDAQNNRDAHNFLIADTLVQDILKDENDGGFNYLQRVLVNSDMTIFDKIERLNYLDTVGIEFNNNINPNLNIGFCISNDESIPILDTLLPKGFDVFQKSKEEVCYAEIMVYREMSETMKFCAEKDERFVDKLFDKSCTFEENRTLFDIMVQKNDYDSLAYIIAGNEKMIDNIIESDNPQKLEVLKNITERYPDFLDKVTRSESFEKLDEFDKIDIFVNRGSINRLFNEGNFEGLSSFMDFKPSCISYIKNHPAFKDSPKEFRDKAFSLDEEKTEDMDLIKNHGSKVFEL